MLEQHMIFPCTLYTRTVDEYNDVRSANGVATVCHFRDNQSLADTGSRDVDQSNAMAWFKASEVVNEGDVLTVDGGSYHVVTVIKARRLGESDVQFIKTYLQKFDGFVS